MNKSTQIIYLQQRTMMNNDTKISLLRESIREIISEILSERRNRRKKPGGGLTKFGAQKKLDPRQWELNVKKAFSHNDGDVADTADELDVSKRTLYLAMQKNNKIKKAKQSAQQEA